MSDYRFSIEDGEANYPELQPLYFRHYGEMRDRLAGQGIDIGECNPRLDMYFAAVRRGDLITYVVRLDGKAVGYSNIYLTNDMHNGRLIAREDTIYILPEHRNGIGRRFSKFILSHLKHVGVKALNVTALTDLRVAKLWKRMGFKEVGMAMTYVFED